MNGPRLTGFQAFLDALDAVLAAAEAHLSPREAEALLDILCRRVDRQRRRLERFRRRGPGA